MAGAALVGAALAGAALTGAALVGAALIGAALAAATLAGAALAGGSVFFFTGAAGCSLLYDDLRRTSLDLLSFFVTACFF